MASDPKGTTPYAPLNAFGGPFRIGGGDGMTGGGIGILQRSAARPVGSNSNMPDIGALQALQQQHVMGQGPAMAPQGLGGPQLNAFGMPLSFNPLQNRINEIIAEQSDVGVEAPDYQDIQQAIDIMQLGRTGRGEYRLPRQNLQQFATAFKPGEPGYDVWRKNAPPAFLLNERAYRDNPGIERPQEWIDRSRGISADKVEVQTPDWLDQMNRGETPTWLQDLLDRGGRDVWR